MSFIIDFIQIVLQFIGAVAIMIILEQVLTKQFGLIIVKFAITKQLRERLRHIGELSESSFINIFRRALAIYDFLWKAEERGASIWIKEPNGPEKKLDLYGSRKERYKLSQ